ncbi:hypothetical protein K474DRAFT_1710021 [Panus rudis PR-1116 ss-1]|nr:hypothetical protein K474DRAFT_1710021 [Panus rudis PR-1116 ss-1]
MSYPSQGKSALVLGATGAVGKYVLQELLKSPNYSRVSEYGRRVTGEDQLKAWGIAGEGKGKLEQKKIDFEALGNGNSQGLKEGNWDVVFIALGTTRAQAGSAQAFEKIDREYVVNAAREAKSDDPNVSQRVIYVSSAGANPNSWFLYPRSKGLTELELTKLGYTETIIFRPGVLFQAERPQKRFLEDIAVHAMKLRHSWAQNYGIEIPTLAKAIQVSGLLGMDRLAKFNAAKTEPFTLIDNHSIRPLAQETP